jgi:hypothetical protein
MALKQYGNVKVARISACTQHTGSKVQNYPANLERFAIAWDTAVAVEVTMWHTDDYI